MANPRHFDQSSFQKSTSAVEKGNSRSAGADWNLGCSTKHHSWIHEAIPYFCGWIEANHEDPPSMSYLLLIDVIVNRSPGSFGSVIVNSLNPHFGMWMTLRKNLTTSCCAIQKPFNLQIRQHLPVSMFQKCSVLLLMEEILHQRIVGWCRMLASRQLIPHYSTNWKVFIHLGWWSPDFWSITRSNLRFQVARAEGEDMKAVGKVP